MAGRLAGRWKVEGGRWEVGSLETGWQAGWLAAPGVWLAGWQVASGKWQVEGGRWKVEGCVNRGSGALEPWSGVGGGPSARESLTALRSSTPGPGLSMRRRRMEESCARVTGRHPDMD